MSKRDYLQGLLAANVAVAEITGPLKIEEITPQTWQIIIAIQTRLLELAAEAGSFDGRRLGGHNGGTARAEKLSPERRKEIAQQAAKARWRS